MHSDHLPFLYLIVLLGGSNDFRLIWKVVRSYFRGPKDWILRSISEMIGFQPWSTVFVMPLPKWSSMTDESQAMVKKAGVGVGVGLVIVWIALGFVKAILPLVVLGAVGYVAWRVLNKEWSAGGKIWWCWLLLAYPSRGLVILSNEAYFCGPGWNQQLGKDCCRSRGGWWDRQRPLWKSSRHCFWTSWFIAQLPAGFIRQSVDGCLKGLPCAGEPLGRNRPPDRAWHKYGCQPNEGGDQLVIWFGWQFFGFCHNAVATAVSFVVLPQN